MDTKILDNKNFKLNLIMRQRWFTIQLTEIFNIKLELNFIRVSEIKLNLTRNA